MVTQLAPPPPKGGGAPQFSAHVYGIPNCWMDQDGTWNGGGPRSRRHCSVFEVIDKMGTAPPPLLLSDEAGLATCRLDSSVLITGANQEN